LRADAEVVEPTCQMLVADLTIDPIAHVSPDVSLQEVARLLATRGADVLVVDTTPVTEITERDIVRALALGTDPGTPVGKVECFPPEFVQRDTSLHDVLATLLVTGRRSLVVVEGRVPVGVVRLPVVVAASFGGASWLGALRVALRIEGTA
jgi:signal-transduction protein with cAMP-binding, CBS, and nucleotidyltransferase domain